MLRSRRAIMVVVVAGLVALALLGRLTPFGPLGKRADDRRPPLPLAPWHSDMSLRATYETFPATNGTAEIRVLAANPRAWVERWRMLGAAERTIDLKYFILDGDVFGMALLGRLLERARAGVRVRLLVDAYGTKLPRRLEGNDHLDALAAAGVDVRVYRPLWRRILAGLLTLSPEVAFASDHDKILLIDGRDAIIGGRNVARAYFTLPRPDVHTFRDVDVAVRSGAVAEALRYAFEVQFTSDQAHVMESERIDLVSWEEALLASAAAMEAWLTRGALDGALLERLAAADLPWADELRGLPELRGLLAQPRPRAFRSEVRIVDSAVRYGSDADPMTRALGRLIRSARRTLVLQTPYLVLSDEAVGWLEEAAGRGVEITVLTNSPVSSDNALSQAFFLEQWPELLARVPTLRLFVAGDEVTAHGKTVVVDGVLAVVGTYNLDPTSMLLNSEVATVVWGAPFARAVAAESERLIAQGPPAVYEYRIRRDAAGRPLRDEEGEVVIDFGPHDHCRPERWKTLLAFWTAVRAAEDFAGLAPIL